jgi:hypothetical protein
MFFEFFSPTCQEPIAPDCSLRKAKISNLAIKPANQGNLHQFQLLLLMIVIG